MILYNFKDYVVYIKKRYNVKILLIFNDKIKHYILQNYDFFFRTYGFR